MTKEQCFDSEIYTNGAFLSPLYIEETKSWVWTVAEFDGDSFVDGSEIALLVEGHHKEDLIEEVPTND